MAREIFEVTKDRFHLKDPCCYILQGTWPKEAKMRACLDDSEVESEIRKLEVVSALERFKDPDLMRGERITAAVRLPESLEGFQKLTIYADMPDRTFSWFTVPVKELERRRGRPHISNIAARHAAPPAATSSCWTAPNRITTAQPIA